MQRNKKSILAPSILSADFSNIRQGVELIERSGSEWIHLDVMDGVFVPNITFGHKMVQDIRNISQLALDVHLMTVHPENLISDFAAAGADYITFHLETVIHSHRLIQQIHESGTKAGIAIVPSTTVSNLYELLPFVDLILIMSVNPGYGGQKMIPETLNKVISLVEKRDENSYNYLISVDGGINNETSGIVRENGADVLVCGNAFFNSEDPLEAAKILSGNKDV